MELSIYSKEVGGGEHGATEQRCEYVVKRWEGLSMVLQSRDVSM